MRGDQNDKIRIDILNLFIVVSFTLLKGYFAKSNSSAYGGTVEFDLAESKQWQGFFDKILAIFFLFMVIQVSCKSYVLFCRACGRST